MGFFDQIKQAIGVEEQQQSGMLSQLDAAVTLTWKQRLIGFASCFGLGFILSIISLPFLWGLALTKFAIFYSIGSVLSLCSTMFLMGPLKQCQRMFDSSRAIATVVYLLSIFLTLFFAFKFQIAGLCLVMLLIQVMALAWYCLTWIPGGVPAAKAMIGLS